LLLRILVADDEPIERKVLEKLIKDAGMPAIVVDSVKSGNEVMESFEQYWPDLIFMDIRMPGRNGLEVSSWIKEQRPDTAIAIVTAYDEFQYAKRAIDIHVDYFLLKPVEAAEVRKIIGDLIGKRPDMFVQPATDLTAVSPSQTRIAENIVRLLYECYAQPITLPWLEQRMNISKPYLSRVFKETYGITIMNYLTELRIQLASELLMDQEQSVAVIAEKVGIPDASHFGQLFKRVTGETPTRYRSRLAQNRKSHL